MPSQAVNVTGRSLDPVTKHLTIKVEPFLRSALLTTNDCKGYHLSREGAPGLQIPRLIFLLSQLVVKIRDEFKQRQALCAGARSADGNRPPLLLSVICCL